jgi:hypothetical protein
MTRHIRLHALRSFPQQLCSWLPQLQLHTLLHLELLHAVRWQQHPALGHASTTRPLLLIGPVTQVGAAQILDEVPAATQQVCAFRALDAACYDLFA